MARLVNTLDHVTEGRIGWNCVTSSNDGAAENYGNEAQRPHDERYDVADEFADVVTRLWEAWEPDAVVLDRDKHLFADGAKVHAIHHDGKYFKVRGPLNAPRSPQGRVPICQAGGSPRGQAFAARWADTIITNATTVEAMKKYPRGGAQARGRRSAAIPTASRCCILAYPLVDITDRGRARAAAAAGGAGRPASRPQPVGPVAAHQHRLREVRPRRAAAGRPHHQRPPVLARKLDRQDAARARHRQQPPGLRAGRLARHVASRCRRSCRRSAATVS